MNEPKGRSPQAEVERLRGEGYEILGPMLAEDTSERAAADAGTAWHVAIVGPADRAKSWSGHGPTPDAAIRAALAQVNDTTSHATHGEDVFNGR